MSTRKKSTRKSQQGAGVTRDVLSAIHSIVKNNRLVSRGLALTPLSGLAPIASMAGYGKKKRAPRKKSTVAIPRSQPGAPVLVMTAPRKARKAAVKTSIPRSSRMPSVVPQQMGGSFFSDLGGGIGNVFGGLGGGIGSVARGLFGGAKKKRTTKKRISL